MAAELTCYKVSFHNHSFVWIVHGQMRLRQLYEIDLDGIMAGIEIEMKAEAKALRAQLMTASEAEIETLDEAERIINQAGTFDKDGSMGVNKRSSLMRLFLKVIERYWPEPIIQEIPGVYTGLIELTEDTTPDMPQLVREYLSVTTNMFSLMKSDQRVSAIAICPTDYIERPNGFTVINWGRMPKIDYPASVIVTGEAPSETATLDFLDKFTQ
jgi:hypothetical protein